MSTVDFDRNACPQSAELQRFAIGDLSELEFARVEFHLAECTDCENRLQNLDDHADGLVNDLRSLRDAEAGSSTSTTKIDEFVARFDSGRHYSNQLKKGACRLDRFDLIEEVGSGSFGYVFRARDTKLNRDVALKVQRSAMIESEADSKRFLREARTVAAINHPAIVAIHEIGQTEDGVGFLVTEFVEGETLEQRLEKQRYEFDEAATFVSQLAQALHYAHEHGVIHRDIKPSNILIDIAGRPHITDFGLAKLESLDATMTSEGRIIGTPAYMSPEQARGETVNAKTDIYSLGVILYEMLTGERPFHGTKRLLLLQVLEDQPRSPRQIDEQIPKSLETICLKAMAKSSPRRYETAAEFSDDLRRYLKGESIQAKPVSALRRLGMWCRRYPLATTVFLAIVLGTVAGFYYIASLSRYFVHETALRGARIEADMLEDLNATYSDAIGRVDKDEIDLEVTHEYLLHPNAMPLPATLMIEAGQRISSRESGMEVRLVSETPFRDTAKPKSQFEKDAIADLTERRESAEQPLEYYRFVTINERPYLKYARGQLMKESCIECHNKHEKTKKADWVVGDLAGVLTMTRPLDAEIASIRSGFRGAGLLMLGIVLVLVIAGTIVVVRRRFVAR